MRDITDVMRWAAVALLLVLAPACSTIRGFADYDVPVADNLRPGQFVWQPKRAPAGPVEIVVSLGAQRAWVYRAGTLIGTATISSGRRGHESPVGRFEVLQKRKVHRSNRYSNAPMPFMQRLNWYGVALHGGKVPGYPASHGCIRLPMKFAEALYGATELGSFVFVAPATIRSQSQALKLARANADMPLPAHRRRRDAGQAVAGTN